jgi:hypothetical protein
MYSSYYSSDARALYSIMTSKGTIKERFLEQFPMLIGMMSINDWDIDYSAELISRMETAKFEIYASPYLEMEKEDNSEKRRKLILGHLAKTLKQYNLDTLEVKCVMDKYLKELVRAKG